MVQANHFLDLDWIEVDAPVSVVVVGATGKLHKQLSRALSAIKDQDPANRKRWTGVVRSFLWCLNQTLGHYPEASEQFVAGVGGCRATIDAFVRTPSLNIKQNKDPDGLDRLLLNAAAGSYLKVRDALIAIGEVTAVLAPHIYGGQDPAKLDNAVQSELRAGAHRSRRRGSARYRNDVFRRYRLARNLDVSPRLEDPQIADRWLKAAAKDKVPEVFRRLVDWSSNTGARSSSLLPLTLADLLIKPDEWGTIVAPNRKSTKYPTITLTRADEDFAEFELWLDGELKRFGHRSLEDYRDRVARARSHPDKLAALERQLAAIPIFSEDGRTPIKYERLARVFREVCLRHKLVYRSPTGSGAYLTIKFHQLRHGYVFSRLQDMESLAAEERETERQALIAYIGWSAGESMLQWYSHHYDRLFGIHRAREANKRMREARRRQSEQGQVAVPVHAPADPVLEGIV